MNYQRIYESIISNAKTKTYYEYSEKHHIIPRCLGGNNNPDNIISLSYREHFLCHWLLCKIYPENKKLKAAFGAMLTRQKNTSWQYEAVKRNLRDTHFPWLQGKTPWNKGKRGLQTAWNKGKKTGPHSKESNLKRSLAVKKHLEVNGHHRKNVDPWNKGIQGVQIAWNKGKQQPKFICSKCQKEVAGKVNLIRWHEENCKSQ